MLCSHFFALIYLTTPKSLSLEIIPHFNLGIRHFWADFWFACIDTEDTCSASGFPHVCLLFKDTSTGSTRLHFVANKARARRSTMEGFVREMAYTYDRFLRELVMKRFLRAVFELMVFIFIGHGLLIPMLI